MAFLSFNACLFAGPFYLISYIEFTLGFVTIWDIKDYCLHDKSDDSPPGKENIRNYTMVLHGSAKTVYIFYFFSNFENNNACALQASTNLTVESLRSFATAAHIHLYINPFSASQLSTTNFSLYNTYKI